MSISIKPFVLGVASVLLAFSCIGCSGGGAKEEVASPAEETAAEEAAAEETAESTGATSPATEKQAEAFEMAKSYLEISHLSHDGLIEQLESENFSTEGATYAADNCRADWNEQALAMAKNMTDTTSSYSGYSHDGLFDSLVVAMGLTTEQATYAIDNCGADWNEQTLITAKGYVDMGGFSYNGMIKQLEFDKYTTEQATYAADNCGADWNAQAVIKA